MPPIIPPGDDGLRVPPPEKSATFEVGIMESIEFGEPGEPVTAIGVGRFGLDQDGLEGAKVIATRCPNPRSPNGVHALYIVIDDASIDHLIDMLQKLRRSEGLLADDERIEHQGDA